MAVKAKDGCTTFTSVALSLAPETMILTGPLWTLAVNRNQNLIGKTMLVANRHVESVTALHQEEWLDLHHQISRVTAALDQLFQPEQYNHAFLMNADAQVHLHVVPRYQAERTWNGHTFTDPHYGELYGTEQRLLPAAHLTALAAAIRAHLAVQRSSVG
jgi:diadenosine tetraphosphate (Ap4A) HIT family hydrolase